MCGGHGHTNGLDTGKGLVRTFIYMNKTTTPNRRFHRLTSTFATTSGRSTVPMSSLVTKFLAVTAIFVVAGATALVPAAHAWSDDDAAVAVVFDGASWGNTRDVDVAADGSLIACGHVRGSTDLDPDPTNAVTINPGGSNIFGAIVKLNQDGNYEWHAVVNTPNGSISQCVVAADGSVYATGFFRSHAWVVDASQKVFTDMGSNNDNAFVAKFAPDGTGEWIRSPKRKGGNPGDGARSYGYGIDVDAAGNAYITGQFKKNVDLNLDDGAANVDYHNAPGGTWYNTYLIKLDTDGNTQWSRSWGGTENTLGRAVAVDNDGDIVVGGWTNPKEMDLDPDPVDELLVGIPSGTPGFDDANNRQWWLSKFNSAGDLDWGHWFGSNSRDELNGLAVDEDNNIYATGAAGMDNRIATGGNWQTNPSLPPIQITGIKHRDIVTAKFDPSGTTQWVSIYGGNGKDLYGLGIAVAGDAVYSAGRFNWTVDFTGGTSTTVVPGRVENAGSKHDSYLVGHNTADGSFVCAAAILGKSSHEGLGNASGIAADSAGNVYVAGYFHNSVDFDSGANDVPFTSAGNSDGFVARYSPDCALDDTDLPAPPVPPSFTTAITSGCSGSCSSIGLAEGGNTGTFTVVLDTAPSSDVVFDVTASDSTEAVASPTTLTFDDSNWDISRTVTITGVNDDLDDGTTVSHVIVSVNDAVSDDTWDDLADQLVTVKTTDDDTAGIVALPDSITVDETGSTTVDVVLTSQPTTDVTVDAVVDGGDGFAVTGSLVFTSTNWATAQTVTVNGVDDDVDADHVVGAVMFQASSTDSKFVGLMAGVAVLAIDDDTAGITLTGTLVTVSEAGTAGSVSLVLDSQPTDDVTFTVSGVDASEASVAPTTITFTPANWSIAQDVTITGVDDVATDGPQTFEVTLSPTSADSAYDTMTDLVVEVTTTDDDTAGVTVSQSDGSTVVSEAGTTDVVSVVLNTQPISVVTITVDLAGSDEASTDVTELTFTTANWNIAQDVTVTGLDDDVDDGDQITTLTFSISGAAAYAALDDQTVSVTTTDDGTAGITVSTSVVTVSEAGSTGMIELALSTEPSGTVVISATTSDPSEATVTPAVATFTAADWAVPQTLTIVGLDDTIDDGDITSTLILSVVDAATSAD